MNNKSLAIYIHWPYCKSKCPYCDFFKRICKDVNQEEIIAGYIQELDFYHQLLPSRNIRSIFFGGGTPSLIKPENIAKVIEHISQLWNFDSNVEISLEANPNSEYPDMFKQLRQAGINRLSLGVQALNDKDLRFLGRTHTLTQALHSIEEVIKNFTNHSIDLIYSRPEQKWQDWEKELSLATSFGLTHLSLYQLTIEEGTVFAQRNIQLPDEDYAAKMYRDTVSKLADCGYPRYEVSNFATKNFESTHNKCYWLCDDYIGIGESAHGRLEIDNNLYAIQHPHIFEKLTPQQRAEELIIMGLRLVSGINKKHFMQICGLDFNDFINTDNATYLQDIGLLENTKEVVKATSEGFLLLDKIIELLCSE